MDREIEGCPPFPVCVLAVEAPPLALSYILARGSQGTGTGLLWAALEYF